MRPWYYPQPGEDLEDAVERECRAARNGVGMMDASTLGKIEIQKLSGEYRAKTGKSLKDFHNAFVAQGSLPIPLVRKLLLERPAK